MGHELRTKVVGVTFKNAKRSEGRRNRQRILKDAAGGGHALLEFMREKRNRHDANAISVWISKEKIGYLPSEDAAVLAPQVDAGGELVPLAVEIVGGLEDDPLDGPEDELQDDPTYGVRLRLKIKPPRRLP